MLTTIVVGVVVFIAGQAFLRFVMEPIQHQRKIIGEIDFACIMYANELVVNYPTVDKLPQEEITRLQSELREVSKEIRRLGSALNSTLTIPLYRLWARSVSF